jgi:excisionase family DNA binding protein
MTTLSGAGVALPRHSASSPLKTTKKRALSVKEFCGESGLSRSTTYKLIKSNKLRTIKVGKRRLIPVESAEALLRGDA